MTIGPDPGNKPPFVSLIETSTTSLPSYDLKINRIAFHGGVIVVDHGVEQTLSCATSSNPMSTLAESALILSAIGLSFERTAARLGAHPSNLTSRFLSGFRWLGLPEWRYTTPAATKKMLQLGILSFEKPITLPSNIHPEVEGLTERQIELINKTAVATKGELGTMLTSPNWRDQRVALSALLGIDAPGPAVLLAAGLGALELRAGHELHNEPVDYELPLGEVMPYGFPPINIRASHPSMGEVPPGRL